MKVTEKISSNISIFIFLNLHLISGLSVPSLVRPPHNPSYGAIGRSLPFNPILSSGPRSRREYGFMNLLPLNNQVPVGDFFRLAAKVATLQANVALLQTQINSLIASAVPKCPTTAPSGSLVVGSYCYFVQSTPATFSNAQADCVAKGGILAEPLPQNSNAFYTGIQGKFPTQTGIIGSTGEIWLGLVELPSTTTLKPFTYLSNNVQVPATAPSPFATVPTLSSTVTYGATLVSPGTAPWTFYDISLPASIRAYICQFTTVL